MLQCSKSSFATEKFSRDTSPTMYWEELVYYHVFHLALLCLLHSQNNCIITRSQIHIMSICHLLRHQLIFVQIMFLTFPCLFYKFKTNARSNISHRKKILQIKSHPYLFFSWLVMLKRKNSRAKLGKGMKI